MSKFKIFTLILKKYFGLIINMKQCLYFLKKLISKKIIFYILKKICSLLNKIFKNTSKNLSEKISYLYRNIVLTIKKPIYRLTYKRKNYLNWRRFLTRTNKGNYLEKFRHQHSFINLYKETIAPILQQKLLQNVVFYKQLEYKNFYKKIHDHILSVHYHLLEQYEKNQDKCFFQHQEFNIFDMMLKLTGLIIVIFLAVIDEIKIFFTNDRNLSFQFISNSIETGI